MAIVNKNTRIGTASNLESGGTYDLLMIRYPDGFPEGRLLFDIDMTPRKITGIQKVGQTFLKLLMTSKGSNVIYPAQGTVFPSLALNSNITQNNTALLSELYSAVKDAESQTKRSLNTVGSDTASMLRKIDVIRLDTGEDSIVLYLSMETEAGASASLAVPFPELDLA